MHFTVTSLSLRFRVYVVVPLYSRAAVFPCRCIVVLPCRPVSAQPMTVEVVLSVPRWRERKLVSTVTPMRGRCS